MKIELKLFDLAIDKIKDQIDYYVDLKKDRIVYYLETFIDKVPLIGDEDESYDAKEDIYVYEKLTVKKECLTGTFLSYSEHGEGGKDLYTVYINTVGADDQIKVNFNSKKKALDFEKLIQEYIFGEECE